MMRILSVTSVKDEGPFLLEWLAWQRLIGVTDLALASNDCHDGTDRLLDALAAAGELTHLPHRPRPEAETGAGAKQSLQWQALKRLWQHPARPQADWMLISDVDEFPMIHCGQHRLDDLIAALPPETEAVALPWRLFGAAGQTTFTDQPVTARFLRAAPPDLLHPVAATYFKTLFRPAAFAQPGVHRPAPRPGATPIWCDGSGQPLIPEIAAAPKRLSLLNQPPHRALVELHHYSLRSVESFVVKSERGLPNHRDKAIDLGYWIERNFNTLENRAALALQAPLAAEIARLKALPGVAALHAAACDWHHAAFERLVRRPEGYRLYSQCLHAAGSAALPAGLARQLYRRFQQIGQAQPAID